jgi:hypothetical protein
MLSKLLCNKWKSQWDIFHILSFNMAIGGKSSIYCNCSAKEGKMRTKEYYYGSHHYDSAGIGPFITHVAQFIDGNRTVPVTMTRLISSKNLFFTFSEHLFRMFLDNIENIKKPYESALKYGFRGYSKGGQNGIFLVRKQDVKLIAAIDLLKAKFKEQILQDLDCSITDLPNLKNVKIVCHASSGSRVIGVMNQTNARAIFLDFGQY